MLLLFIVSYFALTESTTAANVNGISAVRFAQGSGLFPLNRDGVLEVKYLNNWSSICNFGFDYVAASTACYMMGFPPYGVPILNSNTRSTYPNRLSSFNCTGRILPGTETQEPLSVHLGNCEFTSSLPSACIGHKRDVAIACLEQYRIEHVNTPSPVTFAPVTCPRNTSDVRLTNGGMNSGRVEVKHPETNVWGTVCADGFGTNEAKAICRMLCSSSDDLAYAHALIGAHQENASTDLPIHLARISCPVGAESLTDCSLGEGWGSIRGCTHALDVGVACGPEVLAPKMPVETNLSCDNEVATIRFRKDQLPDLRHGMIHLNSSLPVDCQIDVTVLDEEVVVVTIPMDKCGGTYEGSNSTTLALRLSPVFNTSQPFVLPITCLLDRTDSVQSYVQAVATSLLPPVMATRSAAIELTFFSDRLFQRRISDRVNILPNRRVYVRISLQHPERSSKLVLRTCWLSANETSSVRIPLIQNGCPVHAQIHLLPISRNAIGFSFETTYFTTGARRPNGEGYLQLLTSCQTRLCQTYETTPECMQNYCPEQAKRLLL